MYMEVVTVHIRTVDVINSVTASGNQNVDKNIRDPLLIDETFLTAFLLAIHQTYPSHASFPTHPHIVPAKLILYYVDKQHGRAFYESRPLKGTFTVDDQAITVVADATATSNTELRDMSDASDSNLFTVEPKCLRKEELVSLAILRDFRKVTADKTGIELYGKERSHQAFMLNDEDHQMRGGDVTNDVEGESLEADGTRLEATCTIEELKMLKTEIEVLRGEHERLREWTNKLELKCDELRSAKKELKATLATTARQLRASRADAATSLFYVPGLPTPRPYNTRRSLTSSGAARAQTRR